MHFQSIEKDIILRQLKKKYIYDMILRWEWDVLKISSLLNIKGNIQTFLYSLELSYNNLLKDLIE